MGNRDFAQCFLWGHSAQKPQINFGTLLEHNWSFSAIVTTILGLQDLEPKEILCLRISQRIFVGTWFSLPSEYLPFRTPATSASD